MTNADAQLFARFLRASKQQILDEWLLRASQLPSAQGLSLPAIRDHVPEILDKLADAVEREDATALPLEGLPNLHAALRVREGYDLRQVVAEYRTLRRVILELFAAYGQIADQARPRLAPLSLMNAALDAAIGDAVDQYALERDRLREMFIGMLGHDLRDPLNAIAVGAQSLAMLSGLDPDAMKIAERIESSADRMQRMILDLLDFAQGRLGGGLAIVAAPLDARSLIAQTVDDIAHAHLERKITCSARETFGDFAVRWDGDRITQAITNLVSNAISHGNDPISVELVDEEQQITISVHNRGEISAEALPTIFAPFSHTGTERRQSGDAAGHPERRRGSLGLGLYIVREIAVAHGGSVAAASAAGQTTFRLTLPRDAR